MNPNGNEQGCNIQRAETDQPMNTGDSAPSLQEQAGRESLRQTDPVWLQVRGLTKRFEEVMALSNVDFDVKRGQVHGLVGANGAGKSTLIRCLAGLVVPDAGKISVDGREVVIHVPKDAHRLGFHFIHQELNLVPHFDAVQNMLLGVPKSNKLGLIDWGATRTKAYSAAERLGISFPLDCRVNELSVAERWMVSIGRALMGNATMIAMDEPTASLSTTESDRLFRVIRDLAAEGVAVLYVSHRLAEVLDLCDVISVFRDGRLTRRASRGDLDRALLVREIAGRDIEPLSADSYNIGTPLVMEKPLLELRNVSRGSVVKNVSLVVRAGEVLGLGGLIGAGRTELARLLFGVDQMENGDIFLRGKPLRLRSVADAVRQGIGFVPEERRSQGLLLNRSVEFNLNIADLRPLRRVKWIPLLDRRRSRARTQKMLTEFNVKFNSIDQPIGTLSGGNQQKVLIARWLTRELNVLILDEPSRGVDIAARTEIHKIIRQVAKTGTGIIAISSDVEELIGLCDRIVVMAEGQIVGEAQGSEMTQEHIIALSYQHAGTEVEAIS